MYLFCFNSLLLPLDSFILFLSYFCIIGKDLFVLFKFYFIICFIYFILFSHNIIVVVCLFKKIVFTQKLYCNFVCFKNEIFW